MTEKEMLNLKVGDKVQYLRKRNSHTGKIGVVKSITVMNVPWRSKPITTVDIDIDGSNRNFSMDNGVYSSFGVWSTNIKPRETFKEFLPLKDLVTYNFVCTKNCVHIVPVVAANKSEAKMILMKSENCRADQLAICE